MSTTPELLSPPASTRPERPGWPRRAFLFLLPLVLLAGVLTVIIATDGGLGDRQTPPIETLSVQQVRLPSPGMIEIDVVNDGPDEITIAQVRVDDAYWQFEMEPAGTLGRLESATITLPYPWVEDEAHAISILSSTGVVFDAEVPVAVESPSTDTGSVIRFGLVGLYVGVVPVALGLLWLPFLRQLRPGSMNFVLALTIGLLVFLVVDMFGEAQEVALLAPASLSAPVLVPILAVLTAAFLTAVGHSLRRRRERAVERGDAGAKSGLSLAYQIALGIGLHNLGEGLAIGSAFALGEAALGVFLIVGFTLHNVTEGIGIAAPIARDRVSVWHLVALTAVAGGPAILGTWIGAYTYSPFWTTVFLAIGVGAILQVIVEVGRLIQRSQQRNAQPALTWTTFGGVTAGIALMYATALLVT
jgi:zinc transporter ZupT